MATCAISGEIPEEPVVSVKSGHLFEKRLVLKHIEATGLCPATHQPLTVADLLEVRTSNPIVRPRPATAASFPSMLNLLQSEWDAMALEVYNMKQQMSVLRQELAHALYQQDASQRVIARLLQERDDLRNGIANVDSNVQRAVAEAYSKNKPTMEDTDKSKNTMDDTDKAKSTMEDSGVKADLPPAILATIKETFDKVAKNHRKNALKARTASVASSKSLSEYKKSSTTAIKGSSGLSALALPTSSMYNSTSSSSSSSSSLALAGGYDGVGYLFDHSSGQQLGALKGHSKAITAATFHPTDDSIFFTASADGTARGYRHDVASSSTSSSSSSSEGKSLADIPVTVFKGHKMEITTMSVHRSGALLATGSKDRSWAMFDVATGSLLDAVRASATYNADEITALSFHPDGMLLGAAAANKSMTMFDIMTRLPALSITTEHPVTRMAFSENGFHMATGHENGDVNVWDLRKGLAAVKSFSLGGADDGGVTALAYDLSGSYLAAASAVAGASPSIYTVKGWEALDTSAYQWSSSQSICTGLAFGPNCQYVVASTRDDADGSIVKFS